MAIETRNSYTAGHFGLQIDGYQSTAFVKSVEGGWSRAKVGEDVGASDSQWVKQIGEAEIEPIKVEFSVMGAKDMLRWIQRSWNRSDNYRCNGHITHADFNGRAMFEHQFSGALITDTTFPTLDGSSKETGYITCTLQPESVESTIHSTPGAPLTSNVDSLQKMWTPAAFRLSIEGIDGLEYVNKIDSFTVRLETKKLYTGAQRLPEIVPLKLKFPNITGTISLRYAEPLIKWHKQYIRTTDGAGTKDTRAQRSGAIEFLSPDRAQTLFQIKLTDVGISYVGVDPSKANEEQIKRLKFELYVHRMSLEGSSILGFS